MQRYGIPHHQPPTGLRRTVVNRCLGKICPPKVHLQRTRGRPSQLLPHDLGSTSYRPGCLAALDGGASGPPATPVSRGYNGDEDGGDENPEPSSWWSRFMTFSGALGLSWALLQPVSTVHASAGLVVHGGRGDGAAGAMPGGDAKLDSKEGVSEDIQRLKRLTRELFSELLGVKQRLEEGAAREADEELIIPTEGAGVSPRPKHIAAGIKYRSKAQLSGSVELGGVLPWSQDPHPGGLLSGLRSLGITSGPTLSLLLQSWFKDSSSSLTASLASGPGSTGPFSPGQPLADSHSALTAAHCMRAGEHSAAYEAPETASSASRAGHSYGSSPPPSPRPVTEAAAPPPPSEEALGMYGFGPFSVQQVLYRRELGGLKLLLAPLGGSLENIARRLNPSADFGLTGAMRNGHDIAMVRESGSGAAATHTRGAFSLSAGHFVSGNLGSAHHSTVAQASMHQSHSLALSVVYASTLCPHPAHLSRMPVAHDEGADMLRPMKWLGLLQPSSRGHKQHSQQPAAAPSARSTSTSGPFTHTIQPPASPQGGLRHQLLQHSYEAASSSHGPGQEALARPSYHAAHSAGAAPSSVRLGRLGLAGSAVLGDAVVLSAWHTAAGQHGGGSSGLRIASMPDSTGTVGGFMISRPAVWGGDAIDHAKPVVFELSASIPTADGICFTPGAVLVRDAGRSSFMLALQTSWRF